MRISHHKKTFIFKWIQKIKKKKERILFLFYGRLLSSNNATTAIATIIAMPMPIVYISYGGLAIGVGVAVASGAAEPALAPYLPLQSPRLLPGCLCPTRFLC